VLELNRIKEVAVEAAKEAGQYAFSKIDSAHEVSRKKGFTDLVTEVDKKCESIIIDKIKKEFPSHSILAEESGEHTSEAEYLWVIDPLDGTTNYAHGYPVFCVSIGIMSDEKVRIGVVYDPSRDELFTAEEGKGAFLNDKRIKVSETDSLENSLTATGFAYDIKGKLINLKNFKNMLQKVQAVRRAGSAAIDLCYIACGRFDGFWELGLNPWDTAAGELIVKEAGGKITRLNGTEFSIFDRDISASNGKIHEEMLKELTYSEPA
jgi:myo-inositol-1(or 4)-monophosphatase